MGRTTRAKPSTSESPGARAHRVSEEPEAVGKAETPGPSRFPAGRDRLEFFLYHVPAAVAVFDNDLRYIAHSKRWLIDYGLGEVELIGRTHYEVFPEIPQRWKDVHRRCLAGAIERCEEDPFPRADGRTDWVRWEIHPWRDDQGRIGGIIMFSEVITDRRLAQSALQESEEQNRILIEHAPEATCVFDLDKGKFVVANRNMIDLFKYSREALLNLGPVDISPPRQPSGQPSQKLAREYLDSAINGEPQFFEWTHRNAEGVNFPCEVRLSRMPSATRRLIRGIMTDISERKRAEQALRASEERWRALVNSLPDYVVTLDRNGIIQSSNRIAPGFRVDEVVGRPVLDLVDPDSRKLLLDCLDRVVRTRETGAFESVWTNPHTGQKHVFSTSIGPIEAPDGGEAFTLVARDVTESRRAEEKRLRLEGQLRQVQKMEAIGRLAGGVAHDFNNLLTVILGNVEILLHKSQKPGKGADSVPWTEGLEQIRRAGERAASLTRQLLTFSRGQLNRPTVFDPNAAIEDAMPLLRSLIGDQIVIDLSLKSGVPSIRADVSQFGQVLLNLVLNARDAMPDGGKLRIATEKVDRVLDSLRRPSEEPVGTHVLLTVKDTGVGMDAETVRCIFEPFFTTKPVGKGTGLGLATVYGIVRNAGGHILVESALGGGSTFQVYWPAMSEPDEPPETVDSDPPNRKTILVCDDDKPVRDIACRVLRKAGYEVLEAPDGSAAADLAARHSGNIHLLLTDLVMPQMDGRELARLLRARDPELQVLFMSGFAPAGINDQNTEDGKFIEKPFDAKKILSAVRSAIAHKDQAIL